MILPALLALANPEQIKQPSATIDFVGLRDSWCSDSGSGGPNTTIFNQERVTYGLKFQSFLTSAEQWAFSLQLEGSSGTGFTVWDGLNLEPAQLCVSNWPTKLSGSNNDKAKNLKACPGECANDGQC